MITADAVAGSVNAPSTPNQFSAMSSEEFLDILFTELGSQDPFEPNDSGALLDQLQSIRSIESDTQMTEKLSELVGQNELASASNLIGKIVSGVSHDNERVVGFVSSVSKTPDGTVLNLRDGVRVSMSMMDEVITEDELFGEEVEGETE
jgi:flagellar hook assembly protein FlgD